MFLTAIGIKMSLKFINLKQIVVSFEKVFSLTINILTIGKKEVNLLERLGVFCC